VLKWFYRKLLEACFSAHHVQFTANSSLLLFFSLTPTL